MKESANVRYLWALALAYQKKYQDGAKLLDEVLASDPQNAEARRLLTVCQDG